MDIDNSIMHVYIYNCKVYQFWLPIKYNLFLQDKISLWLVYLICWGTDLLFEPKFAKDGSHPQWCEAIFLETTKKQCFHVDLSIEKYTWYFQCLAEIRNTV